MTKPKGRPRSNNTKFRNKTISWREDDDRLLEWMYREFWYKPEVYHKTPSEGRGIGPSPFMHAAKGMFCRFLIWCKENNFSLSEEHFRAWIGNPEATSDIWKTKERFDKTKNDSGNGAIGGRVASTDETEVGGSGVSGQEPVGQSENAPTT